MKSFDQFQENLNDRRLQLKQRQQAQKQKSIEKGSAARDEFAKNIEDKQQEVERRKRKEAEKEEIKSQVKREMEAEKV